MTAWALVCALAAAASASADSGHAATWCNIGQQDRCDGNWHSLTRVLSNSTGFLFTGNTALDESPHYGWCDQWKPLYVLAFTDWDADHDMDVVAVDQDGHGVFFERLPNGSLSSVRQRLVGLAVDPPQFENVYDGGLGDSMLHAVDWDGDGHTDLVVSRHNDTHLWNRLFRRTGHLTVEEQAHGQHDGTGFVDKLECRPYSHCEAHFMDWDGDGDIDLVYWDGTLFRFFERSNTSALVEHSGAHNPLKGLLLSFSDSNNFRIVDWDGDGDKDLFMFGWGVPFTRGSDPSLCTVHFAEQLADGSFVLQKDAGPLQGMMPLHSSCGMLPWKVEFVDWDHDGLVDMWFGPELHLRQQTQDHVLQEGRADAFAVLRFGSGSEPYMVDWDQDSDMDLLVVNGSGPDAPLILLERSDDGSLRQQTLAVEGLNHNVRLGLGDWDGDGDVDLVYSVFSSGRIRFFERVRNSLVERTGAGNPFLGINVTVDWNSSKMMQKCWRIFDTQWGKEDCLHQLIEPILADWDGDGDTDLLLTPPSRRYFERMPNGSLEERFGSQNPWPEDFEVDTWQTDSDAALMQGTRWTVADANGDGRLDILYGVQARSTGHGFVRMGTCLQLSPDRVECLPSTAGPREASSGWALRFADMDSDGDLDAVAMDWPAGDIDTTRVYYWRRSFCRPPLSCSGNGVCSPLTSRCNCGVGYDGDDCSACGKDFYTPLRRDGIFRVCARCASDTHSSPLVDVCSGRGRCFDDKEARREAQHGVHRGTFTGNGSCTCADSHFNGTDTLGRAHCGDGVCPDGWTETLEYQTRPSRIIGMEDAVARHTCRRCSPGSNSTGGKDCVPCRPGFFAASEGGAACMPCPAGSFFANSGAQACLTCPVGRISASGSSACTRCDAGSVPARESASCEKCPGGRAALEEDTTTCTVCAAGTFAKNGSFVCKSCPAGFVSSAGSATCELCPAGFRSDPTATVCVPCPAGTWAANGSAVCHTCSVDSVSEPMSSHCIVCHGKIYNRIPGSSRQVCHPDPSGVVGNVALVVCLFFTWVCLALTCFHSVPIADVSLDQGALIVTTWGAHHVLRWKWATPTVRLIDTSVPWLDDPGKAGPYRVKARDATTLVLLHPEGKVGPWGTSMGRLKVSPELGCCVGYLRVPFAVWFTLFAAGAVGSTWVMPLPSAAGECLLAFLSAALWWLRQRRQINKTPLARQRHKFLRRLRRSNPRPVRTERGPQRAISAGQLCEFHDHFQGFIKERSTYFICPNLVRPLTSQDRCAYTELAGPGQVRWFVSHYWGTGFRHFVFTVRNHARAFCGDEDWESQRYWICTFSNNQWDIGAELGDGDWQKSSFYLALRDQNCGGTAMVLDEEAMPLTRAWCLFEVVQTLLLSQQSGGNFAGLALCSESGVLNHGSAGTDVCIAVAGRLATMDLRNAQASDEGDLQRIFALVNSMPGGFDAVNAFVRSSIRDALLAVRGRFESDFARLSGSLSSDPLASGGAKLVRQLVPVAERSIQDRIPGPRLLGSQQNVPAQAKGDEDYKLNDLERGQIWI